jgi:hypothetical protein
VEAVDAPPPFAELDDVDAPPLEDLSGAAEGPDPFTAIDGAAERGATPEWPEAPVRGGRRGRSARARRTAPFAPRPEGGARPEAASRDAAPREPRHVHAVPTSVEHRIEAAVELFNRSEHPRTVAGIGRSLGLPDVAVHPLSLTGAVVTVVVCWELCWYRYEVDLSEENPVVRAAGQGYELSELTELERETNVTADGDRLLTA